MHPARLFKRHVCLAVLAVMIASLCVALTAQSALAAPALSVSKSGGTTLLGGQATIRITVRNTGDDRGYSLGLTDVFSSDSLRPDGKYKTISYVSASGPGGALTPTSVTTDPVTNALIVQFDDIKDLVPTESTTIDVVVSPTDPLWAVGDKLHDEATARVNDQANGGGAWRTGSASADTSVLPIKLESKAASQSTADNQATGCGELIGGRWPYVYTITAQNNYVNPTDNVVITDVIPDGIEYFGTSGGTPPTSVVRSDATGQWTLTWNLGTMAPGASFTSAYSAGIRYDYYGTANGGTNRPYDDYDGTPALGTPIGDKTSLRNVADLNCTYLGTPYSDTKDATVTAAYTTVSKMVNPGSAHNGETVYFTIRWYASQYYDLSNFSLVDTIPDGLTYVDGSASVAPDLVEHDTPGPGETRLTWNTPAKVPDMPAGGQANITFNATVNNTWEAPPHAGQWIVAGDTVSNEVCVNNNWSDNRQTRTGSCEGSSSASVVAVGPNPTLSKEAALDNGGSPGEFSHSVAATVGDTVWFRVRVNTDDGSSPLVPSTQFGNLDVVDWLPQGTAFVGPVQITHAEPGGSYFLYGAPHPDGKYSARYSDPPEEITSGSLDGLAWSLGDVAPGGWWQVVFKVVIQDDSAVRDAAVVYDYGKTAWVTTDGQQSSARDNATLNYSEPQLAAEKAVISAPANPGAGQEWGYRVTLTNNGSAPARNVLMTDTLPVGMRNYDPSSTVVVKRGSTTLTEGVDYTVNYAAGVLTVDFDDGASIHTEIPAPPSPDNFFTIEYSSRVDSNVGAGASLTNSTSTSYSAQDQGSTPNRDYDPVTANATITLPDVTIAKSITSTGTVPIGTDAGSEVTYRLSITVPPNNLMTGTGVNRIQDIVRQDGLEYVAGSTSLVHGGGTPPTPALFSDGTTTMNPSVNWTSPNPGATLTWNLANSISNFGQATPYVFHVDFKLLATGLITPVSQGGSATNPGNWRFWPNTGGNPMVQNTANNDGNIRWSDGTASHTSTSNTTTTRLHQPYMQLAKTNNKVGPPETFVKAGDTVNYTITAQNSGTSASYSNVVEDRLPDGMRHTNPSGTVAVTIDGTPLVPDVDFDTSWNEEIGRLTVTVGPSLGVPPGKDLVVTYTATVDAEVGSGATLTNNAYIAYSSEPDAGRQVTRDDDSTNRNKATSQVRTPQATSNKTALFTPATIGDEVGYDINVVVPAGTIMYEPSIVDVINRDGIEYVPGSATLMRVSGPDPGPSLSFREPPAQPSIDYDTPNPGATFTWLLNDVDNSGGADFTFRLYFKCKITGLIDPAGSTDDPDNWTWWWTHGGNPAADNTASDTATINWHDGDDDHSVNTNAAAQHVHQPNMDVAKSNDSGGAVPYDGNVHYTVTMTNTGLGISFGNILVDTFPEFMRDTDPSGTVAATLNGAPLTAGENFVASWNGSALTVDFTAGSGGATNVLPGHVLAVTYTGTATSQVGAGSRLTNTASVEFNTRADGTGRHVQTNDDPAQHNTASSTADIPLASVSKVHNAAANNAAIGQPFAYTIGVTVPAQTTIYNATVTDTIVDGLAVDGASASFGSESHIYNPGNGTTAVTWDIGDCTNDTDSPMVLTLTIDVRIKTAYVTSHSGRFNVLAGDTFANTSDLEWEDAASGGTTHQGAGSATAVTATEPDLAVTKINDAGAPIPGGQTVHYTLTAQNNGTSTAYKNVLVDTVPVGMRNIPPSVTNVTLAGAPLMVNVDYWVTWNPATGALAIDLDHGVSKTNIEPGVGNRLVAYVNATPSADAGAGGTLQNSAVASYNSWSGGNGRSYATDPATSSVTIQSPTMAKTQNAPAGKANIGQPFTYYVTLSVPAYSTMYSTEVTDNVVDGLAVDSTPTYVDGSPQTVGTVNSVYNPATGITAVTWNAGNYTNNTPSVQQVQLRINVHVKTTYVTATPAGSTCAAGTRSPTRRTSSGTTAPPRLRPARSPSQSPTSGSPRPTMPRARWSEVSRSTTRLPPPTPAPAPRTPTSSQTPSPSA